MKKSNKLNRENPFAQAEIVHFWLRSDAGQVGNEFNSKCYWKKFLHPALLENGEGSKDSSLKSVSGYWPICFSFQSLYWLKSQGDELQ